MRRFTALFLLAAALMGCGATLAHDPTLTPFPTLTPTVTPSPTPLPTLTPQAHLTDCQAIRRARVYTNTSEYDWFQANCLVSPQAWISFNELPGVGARLMEIYTIDSAICPSGFVSTTVFHQNNAEAFSYLFRSFCFATAQRALTQVPQAFTCPPSQTAEPEDVRLEYLTGFAVIETEVLCAPAASEP